MSSDYFIGSAPVTPTTACSNKDLDATYNTRMETIIDSTIISRENGTEMLISSRPHSDNDITMVPGDGSDVLGTAGDVIIGINSPTVSMLCCFFHRFSNVFIRMRFFLHCPQVG